MAFNHAKEPFDNPLVHKAIAHGIDFATIASTLVKRAGSAPTSLPFSLDMAASEPARWAEYLANAPVYSYNPEKAKELLSEAGYESGLEISLMTNEDGLRNSICLAIQEQLDAIGVKVNINRVSGDEHTSYQFGEILDSDGLRAYDILMAGWSGDYPDISSTLQPLYLGGQTANAAAYSNAALNELIEEQLRAVDPSQRNTVLMQAIDIITEEMPYLVVFYPTRSYAVSNKVTGIGTTVNWFANVHFQDARPAK
jgi:ABC-type transport system substrate-binding protein